MIDIPLRMAETLKACGIDTKDIICFAACDLSLNHGYADTGLLFDKDYLYILRNQAEIKEKEFKGFYQKSAKRIPTMQTRYLLEKIAISEVDDIQAKNMVSSGTLVLTRGGEEQLLCAFTSGQMKQVTRFVSLFQKLKKNGDLTPEDLFAHDEGITCPKCGLVYPESDRKICPRCVKKKAVFLRLLKLSLKYKASLALIIGFMIFNSLLGLVSPYLRGTVLFDWALKDKDTYLPRVLLTVALMLLCQMLSMLAGAGLGIVNARLSANIMKNLKIDVFTAMQNLSLSFFQKRQTGHLMTRVNSDAADLQHFFIDGLPYLLVNAFTTAGIIIVMLSMDWRLTFLCLIPVPFLVLFVFRSFPKLYRLNWFKFVRRSKITSLISDSYKGVRVVKAFGKEAVEKDRFGRANISFFNADSAQGKMVASIFPLMSLIMQMGGFIIWIIGGWRVMYGGLTFGTLMTFLNYIFMIYGPIQFLCNISDWWSYCMSAAQRIFEITDAVPEVAESDHPVHIERFKGDLRIESVTFGYEPNKPVLKDVSISVNAGEMVGIVGHSGAGKSTLVNLIARLYDVNEGRILIDGIDIKDISIADLRRNIGVVSQEVYVFMGTIAENIAYGDPNCSMEDIIRAAKIANAHDFIEKLPDGYDTIVGTGGHDLSGGEKQRISIARAVLHNPSILILDEATASLDTQTERQIQAGLEALIKGRTTIAIAHRLSTLRNADFLVVLENGKICESGTHAELIKKKDIYFRLFQKQNEALSIKALEE